MSTKHTLITAFSAAVANYLSHKVPGVDPTTATAFLAGMLSYLFHVKVVNGSEANGNGNGG